MCLAFKKGEKYLAENYRPISLTSVVSKIMEHVITSHLMSFDDSNRMVFTNQYGFWKSRSCAKQLIEFLRDISTVLDEGVQTDAWYS